MIQLEYATLASPQNRVAQQLTLDQVLPAAYADLRKIAGALMRQEAVGHTLQPAAVVNEAYLKLRRSPQSAWDGKGHFINAAAKAMHHILIDHARTAKRAKRGGDRRREELREGQVLVDAPAPELLDLREALELLDVKNPRQGTVVQLRFLYGLSTEEIALELHVSTKTIERDWTAARAWLERALA